MKTLEKFERKFLITIILILTSFFGVFLGLYSYEKDNRIIAELKLQDTTEHFQIKIDKAGQKYAVVEQTIATQKQAIEAGLIREQELKDKNLKLVESVFTYSQSFKALSIKANFENPEIITKYDTIYKTDSQAFLSVPVVFKYSDKYLFMLGRVLATGVVHDSIKTTIQGKLIVGKQKTGFMKSSSVAILQTDNPYLTTTSFKNVIIEDDKWYNTTTFKGFLAFAGFCGGFYLGLNL
ncbi:MAG: hypothetical protein HOB05_02665 [Bacteroidetes bacterium]|jgi:hypothetical protein|nr:hypothetical protein [Bacteroidota bacterium]